jgi:acylglycerol lipase
MFNKTKSDSDSTNKKEENTSLSLDKLTAAADDSVINPVEFIQADDGIKLAFRAYLPINQNDQTPDAILVFYHGGGAHSAAGYQHLAQGLQEFYNIGVYQPDIRGHGESQGKRGDAPNSEQVWQDINTIINYVTMEHPNTQIYLGGHSSGAGLVVG